MNETFSEIKLFQVKPDRLEEFEMIAAEVVEMQRKQKGCVYVKYMKRFFTMDGRIKEGLPPKELTRIVKCVKYYSFWEFDTKENYGKATKWFFDEYEKKIMKLLIMPFDIHCGNTMR